jgi:4a-hydroxytetrahydrobiopterin dehydratase
MVKLTAQQIKARLSKAKGWQVNPDGDIEKTFVLPGFPQSLMFVTAVGLLAEAAQHHPNIAIKWNKVTLALTTHDAGGLSEKDFTLAKQINRLPSLKG